VPVLLSYLVMLGINIPQDFRYQYPVYVVALLSSAFFFMRKGATTTSATPSIEPPQKQPITACLD
jgi:hypothetical protein